MTVTPLLDPSHRNDGIELPKTGVQPSATASPSNDQLGQWVKEAQSRRENASRALPLEAVPIVPNEEVDRANQAARRALGVDVAPAAAPPAPLAAAAPPPILIPLPLPAPVGPTLLTRISNVINRYLPVVVVVLIVVLAILTLVIAWEIVLAIIVALVLALFFRYFCCANCSPIAPQQREPLIDLYKNIIEAHLASLPLEGENSRISFLNKMRDSDSEIFMGREALPRKLVRQVVQFARGNILTEENTLPCFHPYLIELNQLQAMNDQSNVYRNLEDTIAGSWGGDHDIYGPLQTAIAEVVEAHRAELPAQANAN